MPKSRPVSTRGKADFSPIPETADENPNDEQQPLAPDDGKERRLYPCPADSLLTPLIVQSYEGDIEDGVYHGRGKVTFKNGNTYEGEFDSGLMHGNGTFKWVDGVTYVGTFEDNVIEGSGMYLYPDGSVYEGEVSQGLRNGSGTFKFPNGPSYTGDWVDSKRHGTGRLDYSTSCYYEGRWHDNHRHGKGKMVYKSGCVYDGEWVQGKRVGNGTATWPQQKYVGEWHAGVQHGKGHVTWLIPRMKGSQFHHHNSYQGELKNGQKHGSGLFTTAGGVKLKGNWQHDKKTGDFQFSFPHGHEESTAFQNDMMLQGALSADCFVPYIPPFKTLSALSKKQLMNVLLQNMSLLRRIYEFYSALVPPNTSTDCTVHQLQYTQFQQLLLDIDTASLGLPLTAVAAIMTGGEVALASAAEGSPVHPTHPSAQISLQEFFTLLIVIAQRAHSSSFGSSDFAFALRTEKFFKENLFTNACMLTGFPMSRPQQVALLTEHQPLILNTFELLSGSNGLDGIVLAQLLHACKRNEVLNKHITFKLLKQALVKVVPALAKPFDVTYKLVFLEFAGILISLAMSASRCMDAEQAAADQRYLLQLKREKRSARLQREREEEQKRKELEEAERKANAGENGDAADNGNDPRDGSDDASDGSLQLSKSAKKRGSRKPKSGQRMSRTSSTIGKKLKRGETQKADLEPTIMEEEEEGPSQPTTTSGSSAKKIAQADATDQSASEPQDGSSSYASSATTRGNTAGKDLTAASIHDDDLESENIDVEDISYPQYRIGWMVADLSGSFQQLCHRLCGRERWVVGDLTPSSPSL